MGGRYGRSAARKVGAIPTLKEFATNIINPSATHEELFGGHPFGCSRSRARVGRPDLLLLAA
jgi:hypothetical protein